jgi:NADH-quinone oxidoreductase subunit C
MTVDLKAQDIAQQIEGRFPGAVDEASGNSVVVKADSLVSVAQFLRDTPELDFDYLNTLVGTDYLDYIEVVYILESFKHNHRLFLKARTYDRENATLPSVVGLWKGADQQEREVYDLLGVTFTGHPFLKHIVLWDGFDGYPLRRDYL